MAKEFDPGRVFGGDTVSELEANRGVDIGSCFIDFAKRDTEEGRFDIDIMVYVKPQTRVDSVMPAFQKVCIDLFGQEPGDDIELFWHDGTLPNGNKLGLEVGGGQGVFKTFGVKIKHPRSTFYSLDRLQQTFIKRAVAHLEV